MSELFQGDFRFLSIRLLVNMKMLNCSVFRFIACVTPPDRPQESEKNKIFPGSEGFIREEKMDMEIWLDGMRSAIFISLQLFFTDSNSAAFKPEASCNTSFCFFSKVFSFVSLIS